MLYYLYIYVLKKKGEDGDDEDELMIADLDSKVFGTFYSPFLVLRFFMQTDC